MHLRATQLEQPPHRAVQDGQVLYGRYRHPIPRPNIGATGRLGRLRLKEWHYTSVTTDRLFVAFGLVQLGYLANAFCYVVDRRDPTRSFEFESISPLGRGLRFAPSSVLGKTHWHHAGADILVSWDRGWKVSLDVPLDAGRLQGKLYFEPQESLALLHELAPGRPAYTHKAAALPASGALTFRGERFTFDGGLASLDWTRSVALRETRWKWASLSTVLPDGQTVGLNLSAEVYDDARGDSMENALWLDGQVIPLGGVVFDVPDDPTSQPWHLRSRQGDDVDLEFHPLGARSQKLDLKVLKSDFVQPYGEFRGHITPPGSRDTVHLVEGAFGVVEDHLSVW